MHPTPVTVQLTGLIHKSQHRMGICFAHHASINGALRQAGAVWSQTHKCWHGPLQKDFYEKVMAVLQPLARIDRNQLDKYLASIQQPNNQPAIPDRQPITKQKTVTAIETAAEKKLCAANQTALADTKQALILKGYSPSTQRTYLNELHAFFSILGKTPADTLTTQRLKDYLSYCHSELGLSENTIHSRMNAMKFYYEQVLGKEKLLWELPRPKKSIQLPRFFSQDEVAAIIKATENLKHKTMLTLCYATGMRVSEVVTLKTANILTHRKCILIELAKGKKDRMVPLSPVLLVMLREYYKSYKPPRNGYLFEGQKPNEPYAARSLQLVLQAAKKQAGIIKPGAIHALRHSFATHLLDKGTDISMIQKLLGHNDLKTTLRYLHTTNKDLLNIISPLDDLSL